jgi:hypothetical protein
MLRFYPDKTKVIFFDLEYYVPTTDRGRKTPGGMMFSPVLPDHKILGGTFQTYYPMQDRVGKRRTIWEWNLGTEKEVLRAIFDLLQQEWTSIEAKDQAGSLMLAGIGISHSDVPALLARLSSSAVASQDRIYDLLCGCRQIDLTIATYCQFSFNQAYFSYPKTKSAIYQKYLAGKKIESGKAVWDMYEAGDFGAIERRSTEEIDDALAIYKAMIDIKKLNDRSLAKLKKLEKTSQVPSPTEDEI